MKVPQRVPSDQQDLHVQPTNMLTTFRSRASGAWHVQNSIDSRDVENRKELVYRGIKHLKLNAKHQGPRDDFP